MTVRTASLADTAAMARVTVDTWLAAHRGQVPDEVWLERQREWTHEVSERGWKRTVAAGAGAGHVFVAVDAADEVIGVAAAGLVADDEPGATIAGERTGEVSMVYVLPEHQGRGAGSALLAAAAGALAADSVTALVIAVLETNTPARAFYEHNGGRLVGRREIEDAGVLLSEVVYRWDDVNSLVPG